MEMQKITTHFTNFIGKKSKRKLSVNKLLHKYSQIHHIPYEIVKRECNIYLKRERNREADDSSKLVQPICCFF